MQVEQLARLVDELGVDVFAFGITADFRTRLFPGSQRLIELADRVQVLQVEALCWCGARATHNARTVDGVMVVEGEQVVVGDTDAGDSGRLRGALPPAPHAPDDGGLGRDGAGRRGPGGGRAAVRPGRLRAATAGRMTRSPLVDARPWRPSSAGPAPPLLLDVRWRLGAGSLRDATWPVTSPARSGSTSTPTWPRRPALAAGIRCPPRHAAQDALRRLGVLRQPRGRAYDDTDGSVAARAWWLLRWLGHPDVRLLDGGLRSWTAAGLPLRAGEVRPTAGDLTVAARQMPVLDADAPAGWPADGVLLDARAAERYRGEVEPVDPVAGHVPGARSAPTAGNVGADGRFLDPAGLRDRFAGLGVAGAEPVGAYCGSGVAAAHTVLALAVAGIEAALYAGSWSDWVTDPSRPVTGEAERQILQRSRPYRA